MKLKHIKLFEEQTDTLIIKINKNIEKADYHGDMFGQDVEAKGIYVSEGHFEYENYKNGYAYLKNPLYVDITDDTLISYKYELTEKYKAKGKRLTNKLMKLGYDAIVTRWRGGYGEIVLFPNAEFTLA